MKKLIKPNPTNWDELMTRPEMSETFLNEAVVAILDDVKRNNDQALFRYTQILDGVSLNSLSVTQKEVQAAVSTISDDLKKAIDVAYRNIARFHESQSRPLQKIETSPGVTCWQKQVPIEKVGLYIPGGSAPLFSSILMLGVPAKIAGCQEVVLCTPPDKNGEIHPAILYTANLVGISKIFKVGGAQAIAAMAYGTKTIPQVYKIFGPGNQYVTKAKTLVQQDGIAIDMPAGPSEVLVIADRTANPAFVAADLLSQAEHGPDSQVILLADDETVLNACIDEVETQQRDLPRQQIVAGALNNSLAVVLNSIADCVRFSNRYAPEHLILAVQNASQWAEQITSAGSVFIGHYSCESAGDYASGTNHTLPTNGFAKYHSGVSVDSFIKKISFQELTPSGLSAIGDSIMLLAEAEQLQAHKNAVAIRLKALNDD